MVYVWIFTVINLLSKSFCTVSLSICTPIKNSSILFVVIFFHLLGGSKASSRSVMLTGNCCQLSCKQHNFQVVRSRSLHSPRSGSFASPYLPM